MDEEVLHLNIRTVFFSNCSKLLEQTVVVRLKMSRIQFVWTVWAEVEIPTLWPKTLNREIP